MKQSDNLDLIGSYAIKYRAYFTDYPENQIESPEPFVITVEDPCASGITSITKPDFEDQVYTIANDEVVY